MTTSPGGTGGIPVVGPLAAPFPQPGPRVLLAVRELHLAFHGTPDQRARLGDPAGLPRPWDPPTCHDPALRADLWAWLEAVVTWVNTEYGWDPGALIPACWPRHPHLVHEIAVLADLRRRAGRAETSDALDDWHRYALPAFTDRLRSKVKAHCEQGHQPNPARSRHNRQRSPASVEARQAAYDGDVAYAAQHQPLSARPRLAVVNLDTGDLVDDDDPG